ncbi:hypothetical protein NMY3_00380 [Candidatus Nitrosocosmicus oleophilus]|uniref:Uncharacterized protein n=1 Tax=Candidatus Nitrosocosmicus oleophilus TaxID=1353260 RepID=A0A654LT76_9ARCH|nr:hypothetical protein [Candidatus Nitrosocosmicus oleophilus]ALI34594.1 hypothetical protein NMY3_00380 [Candidatus Nitrosocosmicus oleophilus]
MNVPSLSGISLSSAQPGEKVKLAITINCKDEHTDDLKLTLALNILNNIVYPEIIHLALNKEISSGFRLNMAQIVMFEDESRNTVLLNESVRFSGNVVLRNKDYKMGEQILGGDIVDVLGLYPREDSDPDAANIMIINLNGRWYIAADFIYNKCKAKLLIDESKKSLIDAKNSQSKKSWTFFISELYESITRSASAIFMMLRYGKFSMSNYDDIREVFATYSNLGNIDEEYFITFERIHTLFSNAKNLSESEKETFKIKAEEADRMVKTINRLVEKAESLQQSSVSGRASEGHFIYFGTS